MPQFGLFEVASRYGLIKSPTQGFYTVTHSDNPEKRWRKAALLADKQIWESILPHIDEVAKEELMYSNSLDSESEFEEIVELDENAENAENDDIVVDDLDVEEE